MNRLSRRIEVLEAATGHGALGVVIQVSADLSDESRDAAVTAALDAAGLATTDDDLVVILLRFGGGDDLAKVANTFPMAGRA